MQNYECGEPKRKKEGGGKKDLQEKKKGKT